jgi:endonuclease YncB( thermonuclease family)
MGLSLFAVLLSVSSCTKDSRFWEQGSPSEEPKRSTIAEIFRRDGVSPSPSPNSTPSEPKPPVLKGEEIRSLDQQARTIPGVPADALRITAFHGCYDGDTCTFDFADLPPVFGKKITVRLMGIDTPEMKAGCDLERAKALQAKRFIEEMIVRAKDIRIVDPGRDKYFLILARLYVDGEDIGDKLIEAGLAVKYDGGRKSMNWCATSGR